MREIYRNEFCEEITINFLNLIHFLTDLVGFTEFLSINILVEFAQFKVWSHVENLNKIY